ncbi:MAG: trimethylamine methyltransferase, partial [Hyphomicrobiales bacterium]|nr:trimethylamine methyltransferase [Hyphomicrobiales bacterium]
MSDSAETETGTSTPSLPSGRRGREARRTARAQRAGLSVPYITRAIPLTEVLSEEGLALIEHNAETL